MKKIITFITSVLTLNLIAVGAFATAEINTDGFLSIQDYNLSPTPTYMVVDGSGQVGIGTIQPGSELEVYDLSSTAIGIFSGSANDTTPTKLSSGGALILRNRYNGDNNYSVLQFQNSGLATCVGIAGINVNHSTHEGELSFMTRPASGSLTQVMRIDSAGNVGIGTADPSELLQIEENVNGASPQIRLRGLTSVGNGRSSYIGFDPSSTNSSENHLYFGDGINKHLVVNNGGNVGIGTDLPKSKLDISGDSDLSTHLRVGPITWNTGIYSGALIQYRGSDGYTEFQINNLSGTGTPAFTIRNSSSAQAHIFNDGGAFFNGKVGIGTTTPSGPLNVNSNGNAVSAVFDGRAADNIGELHFVGNNVEPLSDKTWYMQWRPNASTPYLAMISKEGTTSRIGWSITRSGNVGIGTANPSTKLEVAGDIKCTGTVYADEINAPLSSWSDFVFEPSYKLRSLKDVETFIKKNKHLPEIPAEKDLKESGISITRMQSLQMQKIEELTLYAIEQDKVNKDQAKELKQLEEKLQKEKIINELQAQEIEQLKRLYIELTGKKVTNIQPKKWYQFWQ